MQKKNVIVIWTICSFLFSCTNGQNKHQSNSPEIRAQNLIKQLSLEEKVTLLMNGSEAIQRLGIQQYNWWNEALHGVARNGTATVFPQAIGMAASFDDQLLFEIFSAISDEARVKHRQAREEGEMKKYTGLTMWTPNINIFRDPRWGRGQETYGEDPYLTSVMGVAVIKGLQGENTEGYDKLHACAKHYAVHSGPEWNRHSFNAEDIAPRDLWETYLPAFKAAVQKGNVKEVMCAYNRFEGEPCCGSNRLLTQILRDQWGFTGIVLTDCGAIKNFYMEGRHMVQPDQEHAVANAIMNGTDLECGNTFKSVIKAVQEGLISEEQIDISLKRLLMARYELGEMDAYSPWDKLPDSLLNCIKHKELALTMAQKSIVLLQNKGILPLKENCKIALLGPNANDSAMQWGNYNGTPKHTVTLLEALQQKIPNSLVVYDEACGLTGITQSIFEECNDNGQEGFSAKFWNNIEMQGEPVAKLQFGSEIKIGKRDTIAKGVNLDRISAKFHSILKPKMSGIIEFVFTTSSEVKVHVNGEEINLQTLPSELQFSKVEVKAGKSYEIDIEWIHEKQGQFKFNILRSLPPDIAGLLKKAKDCDIVIFAGGISASLEREEGNVYAPGFKGGDRTDIELPKIQRDVIAAFKAAGKKVILVNFSGSAMGLVPESKNCDAVLQAWYPGEAGGTAIVNVLFGKYNPAGRLPVTFYKSTDQLPDFENYDMKGRTYRYMTEEPLFPFGYGLSYTNFSYNPTTMSAKQIQAGEDITLTVPVTNTGNYDGEEVVQVYLKKMNDPDGPNKALRAFKRVFIPKGETVNVEFKLTTESLEWWDSSTNTMHKYPGNYQLMVGSSSRDKDLEIINLELQ
ncbi:MAG: glycoside hydrolase family 3 C-terminal domain-containing protein [Bacteroidales bacterium]|nr:glycoside hydrolase family 3 C-terminal domain-containing protein [Bacteroidales bacterium]